MTMPTPSKTWYALSNKALADTSTAAKAAHSYLHALFKTLIGQNHGSYTAGQNGTAGSGSYWTIELTCNGTTASSSDNFNNTFTDSEWKSNTAGNAHSWFVLKSPTSLQDGPWYMLITLNNATATNWTASISKTTWTGGSSTADPTNAGTVATTGAIGRFDTSSTTNGKTHFMSDDDGNFWFFSSRDGSSKVDAWDSFNELIETQPSGDSYRAVYYGNFLSGGMWSAVQSAQALTQGIVGFHRNGTAQASNLIITGGNLASYTELNGINSEAEGMRYGYVYSGLTGNQCIRGFIPDLYLMTTALVNASNSPDNTTPVWTALGSTSTGGKVAHPFCATMSL